MSFSFIGIDNKRKTTRIHYSTYDPDAVMLKLYETYLTFKPAIDYYTMHGFTPDCKIYLELKLKKDSNYTLDDCIIYIPHVKAKILLPANQSVYNSHRTPNKYVYIGGDKFTMIKMPVGADFDIWLTFDWDN